MKKTLAKIFKEHSDDLISSQISYKESREDLINYCQYAFAWHMTEEELDNLLLKIQAGANADILEDENFDDEKRLLILKYLDPNIDISKYLKPEFSKELIEQICQILTASAISLEKRESIVNNLILEN